MLKLKYSVLALAAGFGASAMAAPALTSPDRHISVDVRVTPQHTLAYSVKRDGRPVILQSSLGLQLEGADLSGKLELDAVSPDGSSGSGAAPSAVVEAGSDPASADVSGSAAASGTSAAGSAAVSAALASAAAASAAATCSASAAATAAAAA